MMKKLYLSPELILISVEKTDIVTLSGNDDGKNDIFDGGTPIILN